MKKILSFVLALVTVIGCFTVTTLPTAAAKTDVKNYLDVLKSAYRNEYATGKEYVDDQLAKGHLTLMASAGGYKLYCNKYTGEVAYENTETGQVLTTNPYNFTVLNDRPDAVVDPDPTKNDVFATLLSQIEISFVDNAGNTRTFNSFVEAAARNQILVKYMKNGFRVEYTMGRLDTTYLLPGIIWAEDFQKYIEQPFLDLLDEIENDLGMDSEAYKQTEEKMYELIYWYVEVPYDDPGVPKELRETLDANYNPDAPKGTAGQSGYVYMLDERSGGITNTERVKKEELIKTYCPDVDYDRLDEMHAMTGYRADVTETPVFRAAIEYVLEDDGLSVRIPASSIRFDETKYTLQYLKPLQFFGTGDLNNDGYVFYPDGSGAIVRFDEFYSKFDDTNRTAFTLSGTVYGEDFAYYDIDQNSKHAEIIRVPVFGIVEEKNTNAGMVSNGFFAILEDGDAMADIATFFGGGEYNFASAYTMVYPRPSDAYNLSEAISVADNKEMTIVSDKKYTGFYKLKYVMLFDDTQLVKSAGEKADRYPANYSGMAHAYRDYLINNQIISPLTETEVQDKKLPLYIETLGAVETVRKILSIPVNVDVPLASFEDIKAMYTQLAKKGLSNVNFKLTGYANGGLLADYPEDVDWLRAVGGDDGFEDLQQFAKENNIGIYPDFDFAYASYNSGVSLKKHAARAVDDRYCSRQVYDPVYQEFTTDFSICIAPDSILELVGEFSESYSEYNHKGISVATLGSDLNSDFNKEDALTRQDAENYVKEALSSLKEDYQSVMAEGGNIYSVAYLDHILNIPLDASNYRYESEAVPFIGMVLHGYINYTGSIINEAGNSSFQLLKSIENGALLYYMLIYQNSHLLKEDEELSKFYSVRFDIWFDSIVEQYNVLNDAIGDLQLYNIVNHDFLIGERVPTESEKEDILLDLDTKIAKDLMAQYQSLVAAKRRELRVKQTIQDLMLAGITEQAALEDMMAYVLGFELTEKDKALASEYLAAGVTNFEDLYGKAITVSMDKEKLAAAITAITGTAITAAQQKILDDFAAEYCVDGAGDCHIESFGITVAIKNNTTTSFAQDEDYKKTDYTVDSGRIVLVTYTKGDSVVHFVLNYNTFDVTVRLPGINGDETFVVSGNGFRRINGTVLAN